MYSGSLSAVSVSQLNSAEDFVGTHEWLCYLSRRLEWKDEAKAKEIFKNLVEKSWFWETTKQILSINNGKISLTELIRKLGFECQADQKIHQLCFNSIIEYLKYVNLIKEDIDGNIIADGNGYTNLEKPGFQLKNIVNNIDTTNIPKEENNPSEYIKKEVKDLDFVIYRTSGIEIKLLPTNKNI